MTSTMSDAANPLVFKIISECKTTRARVGKMNLPHGEVDTPVFMPVGTQVLLPRLYYFNYCTILYSREL